LGKDFDSKKIRKELEKDLDKKRFEHTLGVAYTAMNLASIYGEDIRKAELAGLLHDCAKCIDNDKKIDICNKNKVHLTDFEIANPFLIHAKLGSFIAEDKYDVDDADILNAIKYHTTGRPNMSLLEKIVYVADYIEPHRKPLPNLTEARQMAFKDLDSALVLILKSVLDYLEYEEHEIDDTTRETYEFYVKASEV